MFAWSRLRFPVLTAIALGVLTRAAMGEARQAGGDPVREAERGIRISGAIGLASLVSLSDAHLQKMADSLHILADGGAARSGAWERIREPLAGVAEKNVVALNWFALPDGSYWSVQNGRESGSLAKREYFPKVMDGHTVIGDLVVSTSTGKPVAIVAVPVRGEGGSVVGVLGASVYLDQLSARLGREMALDKDVIFYSFDRAGRFALDWDPALIFAEPEETEEDVIRAVNEMLSKEQGVVSYRFRGRDRTVMFRRSPVTGWWHVFGVVPGGREGSYGFSGEE